MLLLKCSEKNKMRVTVTSLLVAKTTEALVKILFYTLKHMCSGNKWLLMVAVLLVRSGDFYHLLKQAEMFLTP